MRKLCILGSTGSIGVSTLEVIALHPDKYQVVSLVAKQNVERLYQQCIQFKPIVVVMVDPDAADLLREKLKNSPLSNNELSNIEVLDGEKAVVSVAQDTNVDTVMAAIVGASGLLPTLAAVNAGKRVLLANKESLVRF